MLREIRHLVAAGARNVTVALAPRLNARAVDRAGAAIGRLGPHVPLLAGQVADNMRSAGVYSRQNHRDYFAGLAEHFTGALEVLRCSARDPQSPSPTFLRLARERIALDSSVDRLRASAGEGRGAIVLSPHINNYLMNLARLNEDVPLTVYLRWVKDARRQAVKDKWYRVSGVGFISEPPEAGGPLGRIKRMTEVLGHGRTLAVLVDLAQKRQNGVPVRFLGREVYLPGGTAVLALRTGAPVFIMTARRRGHKQLIEFHGPHRADRRGDWRIRVQRIMQAFAERLERMLVEQPGLWYLWGDKRWTRTFRGDPRYVSRPERPSFLEPTDLR